MSSFLRKLAPPDETAPRLHVILLGAAGMANLIAALSLAGFAFFLMDFGPFCIGVAPWGFALLVVNILTIRECRKRFESGTISRPAARYVSLEALGANGIPMMVAFAVVAAGMFFSSRSYMWMSDLPLLSFAYTAVAAALIYFPFNALGVVGSALAIWIISRQEEWPFEERAA